MKSITQEASTIAKAIEQGWQKAGKPQSFSVKVFEQPEHNFLGMTKRSAKVGIFFKEEDILDEAPRPQRQQSQRKERPQRDAQPQRREQRQPREPQKQAPRAQQSTTKKETAPRTNNARPNDSRANNPRQADQKKDPSQPREYWTPEMVELADQWLKDALKAMNCGSISFTLNPVQYHLKVLFSQPLDADENKEKQILRNFALLLLQALRHKFKRPLRGFKVVLTSTRL